MVIINDVSLVQFCVLGHKNWKLQQVPQDCDLCLRQFAIWLIGEGLP